MAQATLSMRVDDNLKKNFDMICDDFGFTSTAAITVFMKTVVRERRIPFEVSAGDPFYDEKNIRNLEKKMADYKAGTLKFAEHELIED